MAELVGNGARGVTSILQLRPEKSKGSLMFAMFRCSIALKLIFGAWKGNRSVEMQGEQGEFVIIVCLSVICVLNIVFLSV